MQQEDGNYSYSLPKEERISSCMAIEQLVRSRNAVYLYPIKCYYLIRQGGSVSSASRMAVSVPKRLFKRAVDRNYVKRIVRESYRLNKASALRPLADTERCADMLFLYVGKTKPDFHQMQQVMADLLRKVAGRL